MNNNIKIFNPIIWRELKRQKHLKNVLIFQIILTLSFLYSKISTFNLISFLLYIPLSFTFVTQNDIFFYDLTTYIETMLSTPLSIKSILKSKSIFVIIKSYAICIMLFIFYCIYGTINHYFNYDIKITDIIMIFSFIFVQYYLSLFIGQLIWLLGKKIRFLILVIQSVLLLTINHLLDTNKINTLILLSIVISIILYALGSILIKFISKENVIERSI